MYRSTAMLPVELCMLEAVEYTRIGMQYVYYSSLNFKASP